MFEFVTIERPLHIYIWMTLLNFWRRVYKYDYIFLKHFLFFDKKVCTSVLATKTYRIEGFYVIFKKRYHPFSYSIARFKARRRFFCFLLTFYVNKFFLRSRNVVPLPTKIRFYLYIRNHNILQEKILINQQGTFRTLFQTSSPMN